MKTRAEHNAAAPADRRGRAIGVRWSTRTSVTAVNDPLVRSTTAEATQRQEAERGRWRLRAGRGLIVVEGLALGVLGGVSVAWSMGFARFGADGMPMLGLKVTPLHAGLLLTVGALALLACLGRRTAFVFSALAVCGWAALGIVCALEVAHHTPGVLGFDPRDSLFYGVLSAYNLVTASFLAVPLSKV
ncbi:MAG: hypothetical protein QOF67_3747 [Mycobacterium sp.]|jgi:hypothetical protein|nr:hypothetical protein [Mycobacterium sp.]